MRYVAGGLVLGLGWLLTAGNAHAGPIFFVDNPGSGSTASGNSVCWTNAVTGQGQSITNVDFCLAPTGAFNGCFFKATDHVSFSFVFPCSVGARLNLGNNVISMQNGIGPKCPNTSCSQVGEGQHPSSHYLENSCAAPCSTSDNGSPFIMTENFCSPVAGAGFFTIDKWFTCVAGSCEGADDMVLTAWSGPNGSGVNLGSAQPVCCNFQQNNLYFMGVDSCTNDISSITLSYTGLRSGDVVGFDPVIATAPAAGGAPEVDTRGQSPALALLALLSALPIFVERRVR